MDGSTLDDSAAVAAMLARDPAGLEAAYRRYADRIHDYARSIVDDPDTAADVVQETFLLAQERIRQLREPARLGPWLYAIARNECLARLRQRKRTVMLADSHEPVLDTDPGRAVNVQQVRELVRAATAGMNDGDREVIELTVRHRMAPRDLAQALDISDKHAHARISRARSQFEAALGALVLARDARGRCEELDGILRGWDGALTTLLRKRIERHARDCRVCSQRRRERMNPAGLLAGYATVPFLAVAASLWPQLRSRLGGSGAGVGGQALGDGGVGGAGTGGPALGTGGGPGLPPTVPILLRQGTPPPSTKRVVAAAAAAVFLIIAGVAAVRLATLPTPPLTAAGASTGTPQPTPAQTSPETAAPTSSPPQPPPPPPTFSVSASAQWICAPNPNQVRVVAEATWPLTHAIVYWRAPSTSLTAQSLPMTIDGTHASLTFVPATYPLPDIRWWVLAKSAGGDVTLPGKVLPTPDPC